VKALYTAPVAPIVSGIVADEASFVPVLVAEVDLNRAKMFGREGG